jgi:hypothetical protein
LQQGRKFWNHLIDPLVVYCASCVNLMERRLCIRSIQANFGEQGISKPTGVLGPRSHALPSSSSCRRCSCSHSFIVLTRLCSSAPTSSQRHSPCNGSGTQSKASPIFQQTRIGDLHFSTTVNFKSQDWKTKEELMHMERI